MNTNNQYTSLTYRLPNYNSNNSDTALGFLSHLCLGFVENYITRVPWNQVCLNKKLHEREVVISTNITEDMFREFAEKEILSESKAKSRRHFLESASNCLVSRIGDNYLVKLCEILRSTGNIGLVRKLILILISRMDEIDFDIDSSNEIKLFFVVPGNYERIFEALFDHPLIKYEEDSNKGFSYLGNILLTGYHDAAPDILNILREFPIDKYKALEKVLTSINSETASILKHLLNHPILEYPKNLNLILSDPNRNEIFQILLLDNTINVTERIELLTEITATKKEMILIALKNHPLLTFSNILGFILKQKGYKIPLKILNFIHNSQHLLFQNLDTLLQIVKFLSLLYQKDNPSIYN